MTFGEKLAHAAKDDPKFAASVRRLRAAGWLFGLGLVLAIAFGAWAVTVNFFQETEIRKVQSACAADPDSDNCQTVKRESDEARSIADTCIGFWKVGYPCPRPGSSAATKRSAPAIAPGTPSPAPAASSPPSSSGGDAVQGHPVTPQPGQPAPPHHHGGGAGHSPTSTTPTGSPAGGQEEAVPPATSSESPASTPAPEAEPSSPPSQSSGGLLDDPGGVLGDVVCTVNRLGIQICTE
jgi:hypothetical protein